jgi:hypothetical protein
MAVSYVKLATRLQPGQYASSFVAFVARTIVRLHAFSGARV